MFPSAEKRMPSWAELPDELIREILTRLPVKSVKLFRCVSKSWLSLLTDPEFIKDQNIRNNLHKYEYLIAQKDYKNLVLSRYKETSGLPFDNYELIGSIRGLVCLHRGRKFVLWNPAIQQYKEFTRQVPSHSYYLTHIGLGFDLVNNDYKIVVCYQWGSLSRRAYAYSSGSASWKGLFIPHNAFTADTSRADNIAPKVIAKDCPYWIYTTLQSSGRYKYIYVKPVKFDAGFNKFKLLPFYRLDVSGDSLRNKKFEFVNVDESLTIIQYEIISTAICFHVCSLKEEKHWVNGMHYRVESANFYFNTTVRGIHGLDRCSEDDFLKEIRPTQGFEYGRDIILHLRGQFLCYDPETNIIKAIGSTSSTISPMLGFRYKPSLVFLRGMKSVDSQNQASTYVGYFRTYGISSV